MALLTGGASLTAAGTATIWTHVSTGARWKVTKGFVGWRGADLTGGAVLLSGSTTIGRIGFNASSGWARLDIREQGYPAPGTAASIRLQSEAAGSVYAMFVGTTE